MTEGSLPLLQQILLTSGELVKVRTSGWHTVFSFPAVKDHQFLPTGCPPASSEDTHHHCENSSLWAFSNLPTPQIFASFKHVLPTIDKMFSTWAPRFRVYSPKVTLQIWDRASHRETQGMLPSNQTEAFCPANDTHCDLLLWHRTSCPA